MMWRWRRKLAEADEAVRAAERLRDRAEQQQHRAEGLVPRVDAATSALGRLRSDNHFGPMIENLLRGSE